MWTRRIICIDVKYSKLQTLKGYNFETKSDRKILIVASLCKLGEIHRSNK